MECFFKGCCVRSEDGEECRFSYYLLSEAAAVNGRDYEDYGVRVVWEETGETVSISGITPMGDRVEELLKLLTRCGVGPAGLKDAVLEWIG